MKKFLLNSFLMLLPFAAFGATLPDQTVQNTVEQASDWGVVTTKVNNSEACMLIEKFAPKQFFVLTDYAANDNFVLTIMNNGWDIGSSLDIQIDHTSKYEVQPLIVDSKTFMFAIGGDVLNDFLQNFYTGKTMTITTNNKTYSIPLSSAIGSNNSTPLSALSECDEKYIEPSAIAPQPPAPAPTPENPTTSPRDDFNI